MTSYNGESIVYTQGYPTSYRGATLEWTRGKMSSYSKSGVSVSYVYDAEGRRIRKGKSRYYYDGTRIIGEDWLRAGGTAYVMLRYIYDQQGISGLKVRTNEADYKNYTYYHVTKDVKFTVLLDK